MAKTFDQIATSTLSSNSTITFSNIPQTYIDLKIIGYVRGTKANNAANFLGMRFNSDTGSNYNRIGILWASDNSSAASTVLANDTQFYSPSINSSVSPNTEFSLIEIDIFSYTNTNIYKSFLTKGAGYQSLYGPSMVTGLWKSFNAINQIQLYDGDNTNLAAGSKISLYGIRV